MKTKIEIAAEYLFVKYIKKYGMGGSWWNKKHINPKNQHDLYALMTDCEDTISRQIQKYIQTFFCVFVLWMCDLFTQPNWAIFKFLCFLSFYCAYVVLINLYNLELANKALGNLKKDDENSDKEKSCISQILAEHAITVNPIIIKPDVSILKDTPYTIGTPIGNIFTIKLKDDLYQIIGPAFANKEHAEKFALKLHKFYSLQDVLLMNYNQKADLLKIANEIIVGIK